MARLGNIVVIANPVAQSGKAKQAARHFVDMATTKLGQGNVELIETAHAGHASDLAEHLSTACDAIISVGGDGLVHEILNGLMRLPQVHRTKLGVVPVGSGNDYALSLGMVGSLDKILATILACDVRRVDVGKVNGQYYAETLSFGLDAAIALDTVERRKKNKRSGTLLYAESGFDQLFHHLDAYEFNATLSGCPHSSEDVVLSGSSYIFAVQIGRTYGGHFDVCPDASMHDGLFDICIARPPLPSLKALLIFLMAKGGHHRRFKQLEFYRAASLSIDFAEQPPAQTDGEPISGTHFDVETVRSALEVLVGEHTCA